MNLPQIAHPKRFHYKNVNSCNHYNFVTLTNIYDIFIFIYYISLYVFYKIYTILYILAFSQTTWQIGKLVGQLWKDIKGGSHKEMYFYGT